MAAPRFSSALSTRSDPDEAAAEVVRGVLAGLADPDDASARPDLLAVFVSHHHGPAIEGLGPKLAQATGARVVVGCTGEGIVGPEREVEQGPALAAFGGILPGTRLLPFVVQARRDADERIGFTKLPEVEDRARATVLLLPDPFTFPAAEYLQTLDRELPGVPVIGGMASGGNGPGQNLLITSDGVVDSGAIGLVVEGDVELRPVVSQGCRPVGKPWVVTACKDNLIQKLGGKQAVAVLMETLQTVSDADRTLLQHRPFLGLAVDPSKSAFGRSDFIVRMLVGIEPQQGAIAVGDGSLRVGQTVQFLVRDAASAGEDLVALMRERVGAGGGAATSRGALLFSCNGRGTRMFPVPDHDIRCVQSAFADGVPAAGFFAMGEIGPVAGRNFLHGFTASVAVFRQRR